YEVKDFTSIFLSRYRFLEHLLRSRTEISENLTTIGRLQGKKEREKVSIIGMIESSKTTKNGNLILTLEDLTGKISVLISKNNLELLNEAKELVVDEVIGIAGSCGDKIIFAEKVIWPDIIAHHELKKSEEDISAIFLSDIHVGSKMFLREEFERFLAWLQGNAGSEAQQEAARKVKYIFIAGDLVDGIGIYPGQDEELEIKEIQQQYAAFTRLISLIPADKQIIICPGNHDMIHLAEPQPAFYKQYAPELYTLPNVSLVTNPALVNIAKTATFPGFDVLLYHGYSFDYYVANVEAIRNQGGYNRADLLMKFLLKRRHLAPSFKSTPYFPAHAEDPLLIKKIPDFFLTGHIHYSKVANYKNVTLISGSCWQGKTAFQEKLGHQPEPARVPLVNLKTREVKVLKFI
ncbi:MAG: metallophosphoesterase, partial [Nanoarchaeota archaeon]